MWDITAVRETDFICAMRSRIFTGRILECMFTR